MYKKREVRKVYRELLQFLDSPIKEVAKKANMSRPTISKFFNDHHIKPSSAKKIYETSLQLVLEKRQEIEQGKEKDHYKTDPTRKKSTQTV